MKKVYEVMANLGDTQEPTCFSNQWHSFGKFTSVELAEKAQLALSSRPDCKAVYIKEVQK